jgi:alginate O-acetyltransferase complex protein AlgI
MTFTSFAFAGFLALVLAAYNAVAQEKRAAVLVFAGYAFCALVSWQAAIVLAVVTFAAYLISNAVSKWPRRLAIFIGIALILSPLIIVKSVSQFCKLSMLGGFVIPLGLSFYTLQAAGYVLDVYWRRFRAERNFLTVALYLAFFPIMQSGPIERAGSLMPQLSAFSQTNARVAFLAGKQILWGFFCKLVIADKMAIIVSDIFSKTDKMPGLMLLAGLILFALQLYFDFYGYTSIAIGTARLFGIQINPNFNHPYLATSLRDFWHRWHMSLSTWLRDYVYLPMGGRRNTKIRYVIVVTLVFVLSGIWHGSTINYIAWGFCHALLYLAAQMTAAFRNTLWQLSLGTRMQWLRYSFQRVTVFLTVTLLWVFFLVPTWAEAAAILRCICGLRLTGNALAFGAIFNRLDYQAYIFCTLVFFFADSIGFISGALDRIPERKFEIIKELMVFNSLLILLVLTGDIGAKGFMYMYF